MACNKFKPHLFVLPEDDSNAQIANGFILHPNLNDRAIQVLPPCGGWSKVVSSFLENHVKLMTTYTQRHVILLVDFDEKLPSRLKSIKNRIPATLLSRVFVLGVRSEPEDLRSSAKASYEDIGKALSNDCKNTTWSMWGHSLLQHNIKEIKRMNAVVGFLF